MIWGRKRTTIEAINQPIASGLDTKSLSHPSAELTVSLILACARRLVPEITAMREGGWQCRLGESLPGATIGLIGLGRVGS